MSETVLEHHGVKGMHWGVRRGRSSGGGSGGGKFPKAKTAHISIKDVHARQHAKAAEASAPHGQHSAHDARQAHILSAKVKTHGVHALSNEELASLTRRMDLEQKYSKMVETHSKSPKKGHSVNKVSKKLIDKIATTTINEIGLELGKRGASKVLSATLKTAVSVAK